MPGAFVIKSVTASQLYQLNLVDLNPDFANTWSSDPASNSDNSAHLSYTGDFSEFGIGGAPFPKSTNCALGGLSCYLGWEDRPFPGADSDFNDLVFALQFTPDEVPGTPEPTSMTLLGSGLIALGALMRRRRRKAA